jgi:hypothetical protein
MKTSVSQGEVSLLPVQGAGWEVRIGCAQADFTEKRRFGTAKWLANPEGGGKTTKTTINSSFSHEQQIKWEIPCDKEPEEGALFAGLAEGPVCFHAHRIVGGCGHHRDFGRPVAAGFKFGQETSPGHALHEQLAAGTIGLAHVPRGFSGLSSRQ